MDPRNRNLFAFWFMTIVFLVIAVVSVIGTLYRGAMLRSFDVLRVSNITALQCDYSTQKGDYVFAIRDRRLVGGLLLAIREAKPSKHVVPRDYTHRLIMRIVVRGRRSYTIELVSNAVGGPWYFNLYGRRFAELRDGSVVQRIVKYRNRIRNRQEAALNEQ